MSDDIHSNLDEHILIWQFSRAPHSLRALFPEGRDFDWLAQVPVSFDGDVSRWLDERWDMLYSPVEHRLLDDGRVIYLGELQVSEHTLASALNPA